MNIFSGLRNRIAEVFVPTSRLLEQKAEWEQQLIDARNGEFEDNEQAIIDAREELVEINAELARRQRS